MAPTIDVLDSLCCIPAALYSSPEYSCAGEPGAELHWPAGCLKCEMFQHRRESAQALTCQPLGSASDLLAPLAPFLALGMAPGMDARRLSATMYTLPVAGSLART